MWCCGPRNGGRNACPLGARTVAPDTHVATGIELSFTSDSTLYTIAVGKLGLELSAQRSEVKF